MTERIFSKEEWGKALEGLTNSYRIFVPVKEGDYHAFKLFGDGNRPDFSYQNTRLSPKNLMLPQAERMFEYTLDEQAEGAHVLREASKDFTPQAIVGLRPCDALAIQLVNLNFDNPEYRDPWWVKRLESTTFVGLGCNEPCSTCFCSSTGGGPFSEKGLDLLLYDLGDDFLVRSFAPKGEALLEVLKGGKTADGLSIEKADKLSSSAQKKITSKVHTDQLRGKKVTALFDAPFWDEVAFSCINCGTCTYLCPTCWCFDIQDEVLGKEGDRLRNWDSCMFPLFTYHGSGHNPREKKVQRVRQRFMHKLKYYVDKYETGVACVGCGRCVQHCPVNIDIREVFELANDF